MVFDSKQNSNNGWLFSASRVATVIVHSNEIMNTFATLCRWWLAKVAR
jgi:hypothetical protein